MANMEERLEAVVVQAESDGEKWHTIVHGDENTNVSVESGDVPTVAKQLKDIRTAITGGVSDVVAEAENARDAAIVAKNSTEQIKSETNTIKSDVEKLKEDTLNIKNQATLIFNDISSATDTAVSTIQNESTTQVSIIQNNGETQVNAVNSAGNTQVANVKAEGKNQVALAKAQANQAKYYAESCARRHRSVPACLFRQIKKCRMVMSRCGTKTPLPAPDILIFLLSWLTQII